MEKQNELFAGDILLTGKHATFAKFLCPTDDRKKNKEDRKLEEFDDLTGGKKPADVFEYVVDVYMVAAVIGLERGLRVSEDKESKDRCRIFADAVIRRKLYMEYLFQLAMLVDNSQKLTADEKISRAFKNENKEANFELFMSYVRGGIEWLYEQFTTGATTRDDYLAKINEIVENFKDEYSIR